MMNQIFKQNKDSSQYCTRVILEPGGKRKKHGAITLLLALRVLLLFLLPTCRGWCQPGSGKFSQLSLCFPDLWNYSK